MHEENITLTFDKLSQEQAQHKLRAEEYHAALDDVREWLRRKWKYEDKEEFNIDELYEEFFGLMNERDISFN